MLLILSMEGFISNFLNDASIIPRNIEIYPPINFPCDYGRNFKRKANIENPIKIM